VLCFCFVFLRLVYHIFPVSLECPSLIAPSVFSNVYILRSSGATVTAEAGSKINCLKNVEVEKAKMLKTVL
jgi:hypothetical protein